MIRSDDSGMSDYERKAWRSLTNEAVEVDSPDGPFSKRFESARARAKTVAGKARQRIGQVPGVDQAFDAMDVVVQKALAGLHTAFVERGMNSVAPDAIFRSFEKEGVPVSSYEEVRQLDLKFCDLTIPHRRERYVLAAASQGAATSMAVTGATVASTVSGGTTLGVAVGVVAVDVTAVLVGMGRIVAMVAAHYGYDVREPDEQVFASGVLTYSTATNAAEKAASLAALSRLTQEMMRRATWNQLGRNQIVKIVQKVVTSLGFKLTHKKLAQAIPFFGVVVNGGLNAAFAHNTFSRAQKAYRLRFLTEKYDLDPAAWSPDVVDAEVVDLPLVDELVDEELGNIDTPDEAPGGEADEAE